MSGECKLCPKGKTSDSDRKVCRDCMAGHKCFVEGNFKREYKCPINTFSPGAQDTCTACPRKQISAIGSSECEFCPSGKGFDFYLGGCDDCGFGRFSKNGLCTGWGLKNDFLDPKNFKNYVIRIYLNF